MSSTVLFSLEQYLNSGSAPAIVLGRPIQKGLFGRVNQYQLRVHPDDHQPAHFHVMHGSERLGSYSVVAGDPVESSNRRLDRMVTNWYEQPGNSDLARTEWEKIHGAIK